MPERASASASTHRPRDHDDGERVAKVIARAGLASRRQAEIWIAEGRVSVNGAVITSPALSVGVHDTIAVDGQALPRRERTRLFLFHKPRGLLTSHGDPRGRATIFDALPRHLPRLISVGRLDLSTEGLLLLTNDGGLARLLELPATGWLRRYRVRARGRVPQPALDALRAGITVDGVHYGPIEASVDRVQGDNAWLTFAMREGKNREVRNVLGHLGLAVNRLIRVSFGPFQLGNLAAGEIVEVPTRMLREQLGLRLAALSGADFSGPRLDRALGRQQRRVRPPPPTPPHKRRAIAFGLTGFPSPARYARDLSPLGRGEPRLGHGSSSLLNSLRGSPDEQQAPSPLPVGERSAPKAPGEVVTIGKCDCPPHKGEGSPSRGPKLHAKPRAGRRKREVGSGGFGRLGEPERARREKRRRRPKRNTKR
jgi:23S rRNA pseudouridine2605 synthase